MSQSCRRCNGLMLKVTDYCKQFNLIAQKKCVNCGNIEDKRILLNRNKTTQHGKGEPVRNPTMLGPLGATFSTGCRVMSRLGAE